MKLVGDETHQEHVEQDDYWLSLSDLMSGLMMVFLLVSVSYMAQQKHVSSEANTARDKIKRIAEDYSSLKNRLYDKLKEAFPRDQWNLEIYPDLTVTFSEFKTPDESYVLFERGKSEVRPGFRDRLRTFFPRYLMILSDEQFKSSIAEIRIEGHTSSEWDDRKIDPYFGNLQLSQDRTREVLKFVMNLEDPIVAENKEWIQKKLTANGLSFSHPILDANTKSEDPIRSRRVEFRITTNAEARIEQILNE